MATTNYPANYAGSVLEEKERSFAEIKRRVALKLATIPYVAKCSYRVVYADDAARRRAIERIRAAFPAAANIEDLDDAEKKWPEVIYCPHCTMDTANFDSFMDPAYKRGVRNIFVFTNFRSVIYRGSDSAVNAVADSVVDDVESDALIAPFKPWEYDWDQHKKNNALYVEYQREESDLYAMKEQHYDWVQEMLREYAESMQMREMRADRFTEEHSSYYIDDLNRRLGRMRFHANITEIKPYDTAASAMHYIVLGHKIHSGEDKKGDP